jgi:hypothetical protein
MILVELNQFKILFKFSSTFHYQLFVFTYVSCLVGAVIVESVQQLTMGWMAKGSEVESW